MVAVIKELGPKANNRYDLEAPIYLLNKGIGLKNMGMFLKVRHEVSLACELGSKLFV